MRFLPTALANVAEDLSRGCQAALQARVVLPADNPDIDVARIKFGGPAAAPALLGGDDGRTAAAEQIQHDIARTAAVEECVAQGVSVFAAAIPLDDQRVDPPR